MAGGIVTYNFEERKDTMVGQNHLAILQDKIKESLITQGKKYTGEELDGMLYPEHERVIIATHKGPMLAKFEGPDTTFEVRYEVRKCEGSGKSSLAGKREVKMNWFNTETNLMLDPASGRGGQEEVGWSELGIDFSKAGSIYSSLVEWLPQMGLSEVDPVSMGGVLDALSGRDSYTMLMIKGVLVLRTLSVGFSVDGTVFGGAEEMPSYVSGDKRDKLGQVGKKSCTIDLDQLNEKESLVAMLCSMEYPPIIAVHDEKECVYSHISIPECDVTFVGSPGRTVRKSVPTPERWWKALVGLACKLGAVEDLVTAFRATRGLSAWMDGLDKLGVDQFDMTLDVVPTRGCRTVLMDSNLSRTDRVEAPTNMACSLGELVCDWGAGLEMRNMLMHISDEFGLGNPEMNRNVSGIADCSVGDSLLREAGFYDYGRENTFLLEVKDRLDTRVVFLGQRSTKNIIQMVGEKMMKSVGPNGKAVRKELREFKNPAFSAYFGPVWSENCTNMVGEDGVINSRTWGATARSKSSVFALRNWMDIYGLSDSVLLLCGFNAAQKSGIEAISHKSMTKIEGAHGTYSETYREVNWKCEYEARVGSETLEKDRLNFVKTYLGMDGDVDAAEDWVAPDPVDVVGKEASDAFRGSLAAQKVNDKEVDDSVDEVVNVDDPGVDVDVTKNITPAKDKRREKRVERKRSKETFSAHGLETFIREVSVNGANLKVKRVPGDGYCVAHALCQGMQELGVSVTDEQVIDMLRKESDDKNWFEVEPAAVVMQKYGLGVAIYDTRHKLLYGVGTDERTHDNIIGITFDGMHCDTLCRGMGDYTLPQEGEVREKPMAEVREVISGMFGKDKPG